MFLECCNITSCILDAGVILAAEHVVNNLKDMSKQVTTPEEIAQVCYQPLLYVPTDLHNTYSVKRFFSSYTSECRMYGSLICCQFKVLIHLCKDAISKYEKVNFLM